MHNTSIDKQAVYIGGKELLDEIESSHTRYENQKDDSKYNFFFTAHLKPNIYSESNALNVMVKYVLESSDYQPKQEKYLKEYKEHIELILLNLCKCVMERSWCKIPMDSGAFGADNDYPSLSFRHFKRAIKTLERIGFIQLIKGAKYSEGGQRSVMQPISVLSGRAVYIYLESADIAKPPFAKVTKKSSIDSELTVPDENQLKQDMEDLAKLNEFLLPHSWASKSSVTRIYSGKVGRAGRIYCSFQRLPQRRIPVRSNCLINGEPIVEVDIKSSHPRLAVALFYNKKLSRTFYKDIELNTGVFQGKVKAFFQNAFSCDSRDKALSSFRYNEPHGDEPDFNAVEKYVFSIYPELPYYQGWANIAMNYEGEIIKQVMLEGMESNIVVLPIHDAVAVQEKHKAWAEEAMIRLWNDVVGVDACEVG